MWASRGCGVAGLGRPSVSQKCQCKHRWGSRQEQPEGWRRAAETSAEPKQGDKQTMRKLILGHGSEAIGTIIQNLEMLARRVTLVSVWRSSVKHPTIGWLVVTA